MKFELHGRCPSSGTWANPLAGSGCRIGKWLADVFGGCRKTLERARKETASGSEASGGKEVRFAIAVRPGHLAKKTARQQRMSVPSG